MHGRTHQGHTYEWVNNEEVASVAGKSFLEKATACARYLERSASNSPLRTTQYFIHPYFLSLEPSSSWTACELLREGHYFSNGGIHLYVPLLSTHSSRIIVYRSRAYYIHFCIGIPNFVRMINFRFNSWILILKTYTNVLSEAKLMMNSRDRAAVENGLDSVDRN